ncbi:unnamed protein product [Victoria cruziana]
MPKLRSLGVLETVMVPQ